MNSGYWAPRVRWAEPVVGAAFNSLSLSRKWAETKHHSTIMPCSLFDNTFYDQRYWAIVNLSRDLSVYALAPAQFLPIKRTFKSFLYLVKSRYPTFSSFLLLMWRAYTDLLKPILFRCIFPGAQLILNGSVCSNVVRSYWWSGSCKSVSETFILNCVSFLFTLSKLCFCIWYLNM